MSAVRLRVFHYLWAKSGSRRKNGLQPVVTRAAVPTENKSPSSPAIAFQTTKTRNNSACCIPRTHCLAFSLSACIYSTRTCASTVAVSIYHITKGCDHVAFFLECLPIHIRYVCNKFLFHPRTRGPKPGPLGTSALGGCRPAASSSPRTGRFFCKSRRTHCTGEARERNVGRACQQERTKGK